MIITMNMKNAIGKIKKTIWKKIDKFACWLSNKAWQKIYNKNKPCVCSKFAHVYKEKY